MLKFDAQKYDYPSRRSVVYGKKGMVCTSQPLAAQAGLDIIKRGGNAVDAAIATAACMTVLEPTSNGIGSDAFALVWTKGELHGLNASGRSPMAITAEEVKKQGIETPAIIVVGKVCALADEFAWYEKLPLFGCKVLVTRPKETISSMAHKLRLLGAEVLELPAIRTEPLEDQSLLKEALKELDSYRWIAFTSPIGVKVFFDQMKQNRVDIRKLGQVKIASIGKGTRKALEERGLFVDLMPAVFDGDSLGKALCEACEGTEKILIPRAKIGGKEILAQLAKKPGLIVNDVPTYDTFYEEQEIIDIKNLFENGEIQTAVFTSASTVRGFVNAVSGLDFEKVRAACIGKQTKAEADSYGMQTFMAKEATIDSVTDLVVDLNKK